MSVAILLSTYNGSSYLIEQLESLLHQTYRSFDVYIRDDGSTDNTLEIVKLYCEKYNQFHLLPADENLGCASSFMYLLNNVEADVYFFCDQDDIWLPEKISRAMVYFDGIDPSIPALYHSDLIVVDQNKNVLHESFLDQQCMCALDSMSKNNLFIQNFIVGCTTAINKSLVAKVFNFDKKPTNIAMHDWWIALVAKTMGTIYFDDEKTILYRQHSKNVLGAQSNSIFRYIKSFLSGHGKVKVNNFRTIVAKQAEAFLKTYYSFISQNDRNKLVLVSEIRPGYGIKGIMKCYNNQIRMQGLKRNIAMFYVSLFD